MSIIRRTVFINPIEPAPLSFRCPSKVDSQLEITYYQQNGNAYSSDVDGQLRLTSRSNNRGRAYSVPAIDVANGKARAIIPAGEVTDPNGHLLTLYGSISGRAGMIARGMVWPDAQIEPVVEPIDVIDVVPIELFRSQPTDSAFTVKLWDDEQKTDPYDMGGATVQAAVHDMQGGLKLADMSVTMLSSNSAQVSLTQAQVTALPDSCWWVLRIGGVDGVTTLCEGPVTVHA